MTMAKKEERQYSDFANVETQRLFLTSEEFPEGSYGVIGNDKEDEPVSNKDTPWEEGQQFDSGFVYEYRTFHENRPREFPGAHNTHDNPKVEKEPPYLDQETP